MLTVLVAVSLVGGRMAIDFDHPAAPMPVVIEALGEALGRELHADAALARDIVIVRLDQASPEDAFKWLAEVVDARWTLRNGKQVLVRPVSVEREQELAERSAGLASLNERIAKMALGEPLDQPALDELYEAYRPAIGEPWNTVSLPYDLQVRLPSARFVTRILKELDFEPFLDLQPGVNVYLPFTESTADRRLPRSIHRFLSDFRREDRQFGLVVDRLNIDPAYRYVQGLVNGKWATGLVHGAVVISSYGEPSAYVVLRWGEDHPEQFRAPYPPYEPPETPARYVRPEWKIKPLIPDLTRDYLTLRSPSRTLVTAHPVTVPDSVLEYFLDDPTFDLFGLGTEQLLKQGAAALDKSLVACLPDSSAFSVRRLASRPPDNLQSALDVVLNPNLATVVRDDEVLLVKPKRPHITRQSRMSRPVICQIVAEGVRSISDVKHYAKSIVASNGNDLMGDPRETFAMVTRMIHLREHMSGNHLSLRIYGRLTSAQFVAARDGGVFLPWSALTRADRLACEQMIASEGQVGYPGSPSDESWPGVAAMDARKEAMRRVHGRRDQIQGLFVKASERRALIGGSTLERTIPLQIIDESLPSFVAHKELGREGWDVDRFAVVPLTEIEVYVRLDGVNTLLSTYAEVAAKESLIMHGYDSIPKDLIESRRAEIEAVKKLLRDIGLPN